jgi:hypothetical protein
MEFATSTDHCGKELCELFGFPSDRTASLIICIEPKSVIEVRAKVYASKEEMLQVGKIIKRYQMLPLSYKEQ